MCSWGKPHNGWLPNPPEIARRPTLPDAGDAGGRGMPAPSRLRYCYRVCAAPATRCLSRLTNSLGAIAFGPRRQHKCVPHAPGSCPEGILCCQADRWTRDGLRAAYENADASQKGGSIKGGIQRCYGDRKRSRGRVRERRKTRSTPPSRCAAAGHYHALYGTESRDRPCSLARSARKECVSCPSPSPRITHQWHTT